MIPRVVLASDNSHKFKEFSRMLADVCALLPQSELNISTPPETGTSFEQNAELKALHACSVSRLPALADDSGLEVDALDGAPGIFSARYGGENADDLTNLNKLLNEIKCLADNQLGARFHCALAYVEPDAHKPLVVSASWEGYLLRAAEGRQGFGYDPIFYVPEYGMTAAQMDPAVKNSVSHRGQALRKLRALLHDRV